MHIKIAMYVMNGKYSVILKNFMMRIVMIVHFILIKI